MMTLRPNSLLFKVITVGWGILLHFITVRFSPHFCSKILPGYPTTRPGNFIITLYPVIYYPARALQSLIGFLFTVLV